MHKKLLSLREYRPVFLTPRDDMLSTASGRGLWTEHWQPDSDYSSFTQFAFHFDCPAMQIDAALYDHQTKTRAWTITDVMATMEGVEKPFPVGLWNSDALVADNANKLCAGKANFELHHSSSVRILNRIAEQICKNVTQQTLVGSDLGRHFTK
jgi:hypothetical protein